MDTLIPSHEIAARLDLAVAAAREAGALTLKFFGTGVDVERKHDNSPVTIADREAELLLRRRIAQTFAHDAIVGEEFGEQAGASGYCWVLDPIDGTKSFIHGVPLYGTLVGILAEETPVAGVIYIPALDECLYAAVGNGAWHSRGNGEPERARVSSHARLSEGLFVTSQVSTFAGRGAMDAFHQLEAAAYVTRTWGDCYGYLLVATGRAVAMVDPEMHVWDAAALQPIMEEAGGTFTNWQGQPTVFGGDGVGTNGRVAKEVLAITRRYTR